MNLRPDLHADRVEVLCPTVLRRHGVDGVLIDLDETRLPAAAELPGASVTRWVRDLVQAGVRLAIFSNGTPRRVARVAAALDVPSLALVGKPWPYALRRGLALLGLPPARVAVVGDQLFTDVLGARWIGAKAILVTPLSSGGMPHTRALRRLEQRILKGDDRGRPVHR
ncbi:MAG: HAD hydrolase-like protein [Trueperaceae bacterium]